MARKTVCFKAVVITLKELQALCKQFEQRYPNYVFYAKPTNDTINLARYVVLACGGTRNSGYALLYDSTRLPAFRSRLQGYDKLVVVSNTGVAPLECCPDTVISNQMRYLRELIDTVLAKI